MSNLRSLLNDDPPPSTPARAAVSQSQSQSSASQPPPHSHSIPATPSQFSHSPHVSRVPPQNSHSPAVVAAPAHAHYPPQTSRTAPAYSLRTRRPSNEQALPNGNHLLYPGGPHSQPRALSHPYPNGSPLDDDEMDVDDHPRGRSKRVAAAVATAPNGLFGSTGRTNFVRALPLNALRIHILIRTSTDRPYLSSFYSSSASSSLLVRSRGKYRRLEGRAGAVCS